ncbi:MAG: ADP-ribose pyrophosphatase YjhB (NUDIX family) [Candidatus Paceibacteria bacterium]|jgi:ADP-ribose pyrophosphatase YjhB (NUDIX family)
MSDVEIVIPEGKEYPKFYVENQLPVFGNPWLTEQELSSATKKFTVVCTDVVLVDENNCFVLAYRKHSCAAGWWWNGGTLNANLTPAQNISRILEREINLIPQQVMFLDSFFHQWSDTRERPGEARLDFILLHFCKVSEAEINHILLDSSEYDSAYGLLRYNGTQEVRAVIVDMYRSFLSTV